MKHKGSSKTFGPRYGWTIKKKYDAIMQEKKKLHKCPYCGKEKVVRISAGIWYCKGCNTKFTSKAYTVSKQKVEA